MNECVGGNYLERLKEKSYGKVFDWMILGMQIKNISLSPQTFVESIDRFLRNIKSLIRFNSSF